MAIVGNRTEMRGFFPAPLASLDESTLEMDIYLAIGGATQPMLYRRSGLPFEAEDRDRLIEQGIEYVYIPVAQHEAFNRSIQLRLNALFADESLTAAARRKLVGDVCTKLIDDVMQSSSPESMGSLAAVSQTLVRLTNKDTDAFAALLEMSGHDFYTTTHMMNVGIGCALLAQRVGKDEFVDQMMFAGFVHDIGKREVDPTILNKEGKLTDAEFEAIKRHPAAGVAILRKREGIHPTAIEATRDHHERLDGKGYPRGISDEEIGKPARICSIVDVYDALTSARPYRDPVSWEDTLRIMQDGRGKQFDGRLLDQWCEIVQEAARVNADELPLQTVVGLTLKDVDPSESQSRLRRIGSTDQKGKKRVSAFGSDRRVYPRVNCRIPAQARFIHAFKDYPVEIREFFSTTLLDISRGGLRVQTEWPLAIGDILDVRARLSGDHESMMRVKVVRVRPGDGVGWCVGCQFIEANSKAA